MFRLTSWKLPGARSVGLPTGSWPEAFFSHAVKGSRACLPSSRLFLYQGASLDYWNRAPGKNRLQAEPKWRCGSEVRKSQVPTPREA